MKIQFNGEEKEISSGTTIIDLIKEEGIRSANMVSVQINSEFIRESDFSTIVNENDEINFLFFMGGGE